MRVQFQVLFYIACYFDGYAAFLPNYWKGHHAIPEDINNGPLNWVKSPTEWCKWTFYGYAMLQGWGVLDMEDWPLDASGWRPNDDTSFCRVICFDRRITLGVRAFLEKEREEGSVDSAKYMKPGEGPMAGPYAMICPVGTVCKKVNSWSKWHQHTKMTQGYCALPDENPDPRKEEKRKSRKDYEERRFSRRIAADEVACMTLPPRKRHKRNIEVFATRDAQGLGMLAAPTLQEPRMADDIDVLEAIAHTIPDDPEEEQPVIDQAERARAYEAAMMNQQVIPNDFEDMQWYATSSDLITRISLGPRSMSPTEIDFLQTPTQVLQYATNNVAVTDIQDNQPMQACGQAPPEIAMTLWAREMYDAPNFLALGPPS